MAEPLRVLTKRYDEPDAHTLDGYLRTGGYTALPRCLERDPDELLGEIKDAGIRGRGGAGFPMGVKWGFVPRWDDERPVYLVANCDESEPGTFKDRELVERDPFQLIEGMTIGGWVLGSHRGFIYVRGEYLWPGVRMEEAIAEAYRRGYLGDDVLGSGFSFHITLHYGAGAYICGEETALLESLEGRRGQPRLRPPFPAVAGLYASPTALNNVETICNLPHLFEHDADWYRRMGTDKSPGPKLFCVSGEVNRPGNYEWPLGTPASQIVEESCGGMVDGLAPRFWTPGGSSTPLLSGERLDTPMDFESIVEAGSLLGTAALQVFSERTSVVEAVRNWTKFYEHESCGKCTPCREGTFWFSQVYDRLLDGRGVPGDLEVLADGADNMFGRVLCALGDGAAMPIKSSIELFRDEYEHLIEHGRLPDHLREHAGTVADNSQSDRPTEYARPRPEPVGGDAGTEAR